MGPDVDTDAIRWISTSSIQWISLYFGSSLGSPPKGRIQALHDVYKLEIIHGSLIVYSNSMEENDREAMFCSHEKRHVHSIICAFVFITVSFKYWARFELWGDDRELSPAFDRNLSLMFLER
jgi:hypothetical protein